MQKEEKSRKILKLIYLIIAAILIAVMIYSVSGRNDNDGEAAMENSQEVVTDEAVQGGAFEVTDYLMNVIVRGDHSYKIEETVSVSIPKQVQSINLSIPSGNFRVSDIKVADTAHYSSSTLDAGSITIIDPAKLTEGRQSYDISYTIREFDDRDGEQDIFYFNALPPDWKQPIANLEIDLQFPSDFPWEDVQCYAGQFGVQDMNNRVSVEMDEASKAVHIKGERLPENYSITVKADLPNRYWRGALNGAWVLRTIIGIMGAVLLILALLWVAGGRDPKIEKTEVNKPIEGVLPSDLGYIFNSKVGIRDIVLLLMYFGRKGYLRISEYEPKAYRIYRGEDPVGEEKLYRNAFNILFEDIYKGRAVEMEDLGDRLMRMRSALRNDIAAGYASAESASLTPRSRLFRYIGGVLLSIALGVCNALTYRFEYLQINFAESLVISVLFGGALYVLGRAVDRRESQSDGNNRLIEYSAMAVILGIIYYVARAVLVRTTYMAAAVELAIMSILAIFFIIIMRARGKDNAELVMKIRQLWQFIYHPTPKELLENHLADENYYYDMLLYALAAGAEESWAISFLTLNVPAPDWFSHDVEGHAFSNIREQETTLDYARDLKIFMRTIENAFADYIRRRR